MDYAQWYKRVSRRFDTARGRRALALADKALVYAFAAGFVAGLAALLLAHDVRAVRFAAVPAFTFVLVTVVRRVIDAPRPYEAFPIDPLVHKDTRGKSLPSRHMASAVAIACAAAWVGLGWGVIGFAGCVAVAFTRIVGGVHFPRDIATAAALSIACSLVGFA